VIRPAEGGGEQAPENRKPDHQEMPRVLPPLGFETYRQEEQQEKEPGDEHPHVGGRNWPNERRQVPHEDE